MERTEAKNVLSGLEGDPCGGQGLGSPPVQQEMEEQTQVKKLVSHFPASALGGWESMEHPPNEDMRWGRPGFVIHGAEEGGPGSPGWWGQCGSNDVVTGTKEPGICFPRPPLGLWAREFLGDPWGRPQESQGSMQVS